MALYQFLLRMLINGRHHCHVQKLARHLLAPNCSGWTWLWFSRGFPTRNYPPQEVCRHARSHKQAICWQDVAIDESVPRYQAIPLSQSVDSSK
jgi:hypothetical protein